MIDSNLSKQHGGRIKDKGRRSEPILIKKNINEEYNNDKEKTKNKEDEGDETVGGYASEGCLGIKLPDP